MLKMVVHKIIRKIFNIVEYCLGLIIRLLTYNRIEDDKIVFISYFGKDIGDNPGAILEEIIKTSKIKIVVATNNKHLKVNNDRIIYVNYGRHLHIRMLYEIRTARIIVNNCRFDFNIYKKSEQLYIQTWHGGGAQKKCEQDVEDKLSKEYVKAAKIDANYVDIMIADSTFMMDLYHRAFWYDGPVYKCGYPRYDKLFQSNNNCKNRVMEYYNIDSDCEFVLYAPTFRNNNSIQPYGIDYHRLCASLEKRYNKKFKVLVHFHPNVANKSNSIDYNNEVINATFYPDTNDLLIASDVLIGDYSAINYDFCLTGKPVFRFATDLKEYLSDRDLYFSFNEYPFPAAKNNDELVEIIQKYDEKTYTNLINDFLNRIGAVTESGASKKVADLMLLFIQTKNKNNIYQTKDMYFVKKDNI